MIQLDNNMTEFVYSLMVDGNLIAEDINFLPVEFQDVILESSLSADQFESGVKLGGSDIKNFELKNSRPEILSERGDILKANRVNLT